MMQRSGSPVRAAALLLIAVLLGPPSEAAAQVLEGHVLDGSSDQPLADASVQALAPEGFEVGDPVVSGPDGSFVLSLPDTGVYYIRVDRLSYGTIVDGEFVFSARDGRISVDVYLLPTPVELEGLEVRTEMVATRRSLRSQGFYERAAAGFGDFIGPEEIEERMVGNVTDYMRSIPQLFLEGGILKIRGNQLGACEPNVYVDGALMLSDWHAASLPPEMRKIDYIVRPDHVSAIEVYRRVSSTPLQWREPNASCGTIVIWTKTGRQGTTSW